MSKPATVRLVQLTLMLIIGAPGAFSQESRPQQDIAPPPLRIISREERAQINAEKNQKDRVKTTIELANAHLTTAETETSKQDYDKAASAAGRYWALIENAFAFLKTLELDSNRTRDLYKRIELTLRAHGPRLATIRRSTPVEYSVWIKEIEDLARTGRTEALNSFYGETVVHDRQPKPSKKQDQKPNP